MPKISDKEYAELQWWRHLSQRLATTFGCIFLGSVIGDMISHNSFWVWVGAISLPLVYWTYLTKLAK